MIVGCFCHYQSRNQRRRLPHLYGKILGVVGCNSCPRCKVDVEGIEPVGDELGDGGVAAGRVDPGASALVVFHVGGVCSASVSVLNPRMEPMVPSWRR